MGKFRMGTPLLVFGPSLEEQPAPSLGLGQMPMSIGRATRLG